MALIKKLHWFEWTVLISILGIHIYTALSGAHNFPIRWFTRDDAYYYFKVAQNISQGMGSTFDGINLTNGYHPLWMLVCIPIFALARFDLILPLRVLVVVMAILDVLTSILLFRLLRKVMGEWVAILLVGFWTYTINVHATVFQQGMETGVVVLSTVVLLLMARNLAEGETPAKAISWREGTLFGLAAVFALFSRLDMVFMVLFASLYVMLRNQPAFRNLAFLELLLAYTSSILLFIANTDLKSFLMAFDTSALAFTVLAYAGMLLTGWMLGLYKAPSVPGISFRIVIKSLIAAAVGALLGLGGVLLLNVLNPIYNMPKLVALGFVPAMSVGLLLLRWAAWALGWHAQNDRAQQDANPLLEVKANMATLRALLPVWAADAMRLGWLSAGSLLLYMAFNRFMFGTFMPVSGQIKRWWGGMDSNVYGGPSQTIANIFGVDHRSGEGWLYITVPMARQARVFAKMLGNMEQLDTIYWALLAMLLLAAVTLLVWRWRQLQYDLFTSGFFLLFCGSMFTVLFYGASAYSAKHEWYWAPQMMATVMFFGFFAQAAVQVLNGQRMPQWVGRVLVPAGVLLYIGMLFVQFNSEMITRMPFVDPDPNDPYVDVLPRIEQNTEPGALIGMTGGGNVGYFIQGRTIMNMDGLINSYEYFTALQKSEARAFYKKVGLDYVFASKFILVKSAPYSFQFDKTELPSVKSAEAYGNKELLYYKPLP